MYPVLIDECRLLLVFNNCVATFQSTYSIINARVEVEWSPLLSHNCASASGEHATQQALMALYTMMAATRNDVPAGETSSRVLLPLGPP